MKRIADKGSSERFLLAHVQFSGDECLPWPYGRNNNGYGLAVIGGVQKTASRWMCLLAHGEPSPPRIHAAHNCGNPQCVNPRHLRWASHAENMADKVRHGTLNRGERNGKTHLSEDDVRAIRAAPPDLAPLMARYGLTKGGLCKIRTGKRWGHIK
jgi:hypothetical protein